MTANIAHLTTRALIGVSGPDWRSFLQGLITQDVETLRPDEMRYGALLTPQGRLLYDLFITGDDEGGVLDVAASERDELIAKLTMYRLRAKVQVAALDVPVFVAWGDAPTTEGDWRADPRTPDLGWRNVSSLQTTTASQADYDAHRLSLGVPDPAKDAAANDYPIEMNFDVLHAIDFKKGCFVGQETTSRMYRRGVVKTRLAPIAFEGPTPAFGTDIMAGDRRAGEVRGGLDGHAMALLRIDRSQGEPLTVDGRMVALNLPLWLAVLFQTPVDEAPQS